MGICLLIDWDEFAVVHKTQVIREKERKWFGWASQSRTAYAHKQE